MPESRIHFVTGRLAEPSLREVLAELAPRAGFAYTIESLPITVAALMTPEWIAPRIHVPPGTTRVLLPGYCDGDLSVVERAAGAPTERGPRDLRRLPEFFGQGPPPTDYGAHDIQIVAEINHCPRLSLAAILDEAKSLAAAGADVIDVGCDPGGLWSGAGETVRALREAGHRVSIDSLDPREIEPAARAGAELVLSVNSTNRHAAADWGCEVVVVPDQFEGLVGLEETVGMLADAGVRLRIDPVLEPIGLGFAASLGRYYEVRRRWPDAEMLMGVANLTELTDVDSAGINVLLLALCEELGIRSVLTTQVINWARSSVRECDLARRLVHYAVEHRALPKHVEPRLVMLRGPTPAPQGTAALDRLAAEIKDPNYRIFAEDGEIHVVSAGVHLADADPFLLFERLLWSGAKNLDPAHAFYLGYEMAKAATALTLSKEYRQDEALDWGFLTRAERHHRLNREKRNRAEGPKSSNRVPLLACPAVESSHADSTAGQASSGTQQLTPVEPVAEDCPAAVQELRPAPDVEEAFLRLAALPRCVFFDSARRDPRLGRYSFIAADPFEFIEIAGAARDSAADPFAELSLRLAPFASATIAGLPPFQGGAAGVMSYDLAALADPTVRPRFDEFGIPALAVGLYDVVVAFDHVENRAWIISQGFPELDPSRRRRRAEERLQEFRRRLESPLKRPAARRDWASPLPRISPAALAPQFAAAELAPSGPSLTSNMSAEQYLATIRRAIEYIRAGDVFQVNIAQRLLAPAADDAVSLYLRLRRRNPAPFAAFFDLGAFQIASASPERFLKIAERRIEARPIKGTCRRAGLPEADLFAGDALRGSAKDNAENVMIVDLLRNDLARVCRPESVVVEALCRLESYEFVQHLVSVVRGELREGVGPLEAVRAAFPGGSVTGAPKRRAMQIIAELEPTARGAYCGSLGYLGFDGALDASILIRTITAGRGWWQMSVGGGIVAASDPRREYEETWQKAEGMLRAVGKG